jgi:nickel/cobalt transporter (NiCoT) family protein
MRRGQFDEREPTWVSALNLNNVGFTIVGLFVATWACAIAYWRLTGAEGRWQTAQPGDAGE